MAKFVPQLEREIEADPKKQKLVLKKGHDETQDSQYQDIILLLHRLE